jgi:signal transduction histidine kinase/CheY-like chemotaxis protein
MMRPTSPSTTEPAGPFLSDLTLRAAVALEMDVVCIGRPDPDRTRIIGVSAVVLGEVSELSYAIAGSPCERTLTGEAWCQASGVVELFPRDAELQQMNAESYLGVPIRDAKGEIVAVLSAISSRPIKDVGRTLSIAEAFASGAEVELERRRLRWQSDIVVRALDQSDDGVVVTDRDGNILHMNQIASAMLTALGRSPEPVEQINGRTLPMPEAWWNEVGRRRDAGERWVGRIGLPAEAAGGDARTVELRGSARGADANEEVWLLRDVTDEVRRERWLARRARESFLHATISSTLQQQTPLRERLQYVLAHTVALPELSRCLGAAALLSSERAEDARPLVTTGANAPREAIQISELDRFTCAEQVGCMRSNSHVDYVFPLTVEGGVAGALVFRLPEEVSGLSSRDGVIAHICELVALSITNERLEDALRRTKEAAEAANRAKTRFLASVSHEIRTPMTVIMGAAERLLEDDRNHTDPERMREAASLIADSGTHLMTIVTDMLDLSRIETGNLHLKERAFSPIEVVQQVVEGMRLRTEAKGLVIRIEQAGDPSEPVVSDPHRIRQILDNLVGNAVKFTDSGSVTVRVEIESGDRLVLAVQDTGPGIRPELHESIFQPFSQVDSGLRRTHGGVGLGLSICRQLAELLGGSVSVESSLGRGSRFTLQIPVKPAQHDPCREPTEPAPQQFSTQPLSGRCILLAEDSPPVQQLIQHFLKRAGAEVVLADNGIQAVQAWRRRSRTGRPIDLILMDMQMPRLDGYGAASMLRSLACSTPIIALTAHAMPGDGAPCLAAGCDAYETKPVERERLVRRCLDLIAEAERARHVA